MCTRTYVFYIANLQCEVWSWSVPLEAATKRTRGKNWSEVLDKNEGKTVINDISAAVLTTGSTILLGSTRRI